MTWLSAAVISALAWTSLPSKVPNAQLQSTTSVGSSASPMEGTGVVGKLSTNLDTKRSKLGDRVAIEVTQDATLGTGVLLRKGSHIIGRITHVNAYSKGEFNGKLEIVLDHIALKSGEQISSYFAISALLVRQEQETNSRYDPTELEAIGNLGMKDSGAISRTAGHSGVPPNGRLKPDTRGVFGPEGLTLTPIARTNPLTSVVRSTREDIRLEKGTEIVLVLLDQNVGALQTHDKSRSGTKTAQPQ